MHFQAERLWACEGEHREPDRDETITYSPMEGTGRDLPMDRPIRAEIIRPAAMAGRSIHRSEATVSGQVSAG
jgi:hypothetical protein